MELMGTFLDEEWESLCKMFSGGENSDSLLQCDGGGLFPATGETPFLSYSEDPYLLSHHDHTFETNFCSSISQESSNTSEIERSLLCDDQDYQQHVHDNENASFGMYNMIPVFSDDAMEQILNSNDSNCNEIKRKYNNEPEDHSLEISPNKIPRVSRNARKNGKKKKIEEKNNVEESKSSCSSEDDSQEINGGSTSESKGKKKPSRGSATDPQSLYARKRRERINERLKILQGLVPNGTKVDISTMLEEAVQYVKFLQLQIKLLSSDDLWMYAPIAYNGMDIGMYQNISPSLRLHIN